MHNIASHECIDIHGIRDDSTIRLSNPAKYVHLIAILLACLTLACGSKTNTTYRQPGETKLSSDGSTIPWPANGVCALTAVNDQRCHLLHPQDGLLIHSALGTYFRSQEAAGKHSQSDLREAERALGPPHVVPYGQALAPVVGRFFIYVGDTKDTLRIQNTVVASQTTRWGFRIQLRKEKQNWLVASFGYWKNLPGPNPKK